MKILVVGSGGRENAIVWRLAQSNSAKKIFCAPGNPGISKLAECVNIKVDDISGLLSFAKNEKIDLTVVGPEYPLTLGIVDQFRASGLKIFGPTQKAVQLEASKDFAKEVMVAAGVPTAKYAVCTTAEQLLTSLQGHPIPVVLKADGLAAGKGVYVCHTKQEALSAVKPLFEELKADKVIVEEFLDGVEASLIVATDGDEIVPLAASHDYKRIYDNDKGPNTGGMGTVSPTSHLSQAQADWAIDHVIKPVITEMNRRGTPFSGFLYAGLMINSSGKINVLEFNARLGDPETQVIMRRIESDFAALLDYLATQTKPRGATLPQVTWSEKNAICLVLAADDYPAKPKVGDEITGINLAETLDGIAVFHAGTSINQAGKLVTAGGRVLNVTATGMDLAQARSLAYKAADMIQFRGRQLRRDIGLR